MKKITLLTIVVVLIISRQVSAQSLIGEYEGKSNRTDWSATLTLQNNNRFKMTQGLSLNHESFHTRGYYFLLKDTLILCSEKWNDPNMSTYQINENQGKTTGYRNISKIQIKDKERNPLPGVLVVFQNKCNEDVFIKLSDKDGRIEEMLLETQQIGKISFRSISSKPLTIDFNNVNEESFSIDVTLGIEDYGSYDKTSSIEKFLIKKQRNKISFHNKWSEGNQVIYSKK